MSRTFVFGVGLAGCFLLAASAAHAAQAIPASVSAAVNDHGRPGWDLLKDDDNKPTQVLSFAGIRPGMTVADLIPGEGYYTRILSKLVGAKGHVYAVVSHSGGMDIRKDRIAQRAGEPPAQVFPKDVRGCILGCYPMGRPPALLPIDYILAIQNVSEYANVTALGESLGGPIGEFAVPAQLDAVFSADGYHTLHAKDTEVSNIATLNRQIFRSIKPGGVYLIIDNAATKGTDPAYAAALDRSNPEAVRAELTAVGFVLDGQSDALVNSADDHTAPASDTADRFILRFRKPANAAGTAKRPKNSKVDPLANYYGNTYVTGVGAPGNTTGHRPRYVYWNRNGTYQEFGQIGAGPAPMQSGTWFWDAEGFPCMLHQFPLDERGMIVCQHSVVARPVGVVQEVQNGGRALKVEIMKGYQRPPATPYRKP